MQIYFDKCEIRMNDYETVIAPVCLLPFGTHQFIVSLLPPGRQTLWMQSCVVIPLAQRSCCGMGGGGGGVYRFHSVSPFVCPSVRPASRARFVAPTVLVGSISYLHIVSSNFRMCVKCKDSYKIFKFKFLTIYLNL